MLPARSCARGHPPHLGVGQRPYTATVSVCFWGRLCPHGWRLSGCCSYSFALPGLHSACRLQSQQQFGVCRPLSMGKKQSGLFWFDCPVLLQELNGWAGSERKAWCVRDALLQYWFLVLSWLHVKLFAVFIILIFIGARKGFRCCAL